MFVESSAPFKLCYYKKNVVGGANRSRLMMSFTCVHYLHVVMAGSVFEDKILLSKKDSLGVFHVEDSTFPSKSKEMSLYNFVENFKGSDGIDFIVIRIPLYFLLTRQQDRTVRIFMTNAHDYVKMFTSPGAFFDVHTSETCNCTREFVPSIMDLEADWDEVLRSQGSGSVGNAKAEGNGASRSDAEDKAFVVDVDGCLTDQEFEEFLRENSITSTVLLGKTSDGVTKFCRYPLLDSSNDALREITKQFCEHSFDFVEILGKTKIAGMRTAEEVVWYAEAPCNSEDECHYIEGLNGIFRKFVPESSETGVVRTAGAWPGII